MNKLVGMALLCSLGACAGVKTLPNSGAADVTRTEHGTIHAGDEKVPENLIKIEQRLRNTVAADGNDVDALVQLGVLYRHMENFNAAIEMLTRAEKITGGSAMVLNEIAIVQRTSGAFEHARNTYNRILNVTPDYYDAHFNLGILYDLYLGQPELAHAHYEAYLQSAPETDAQVKKWVVDLRRRYGIKPSSSLVKANEQ